MIEQVAQTYIAYSFWFGMAFLSFAFVLTLLAAIFIPSLKTLVFDQKRYQESVRKMNEIKPKEHHRSIYAPLVNSSKVLRFAVAVCASAGFVNILPANHLSLAVIQMLFALAGAVMLILSLTICWLLLFGLLDVSQHQERVGR